MTSTRDKRRELEHLVQLYDTALARQKNLLDKFNKGKFKSTQISDEQLQALILGDLKLLEKARKEFGNDLENITTLNGHDQGNILSNTSGDQ